MELNKSLNQSPQSGLENIGYTSSNGLLENCCKVRNKYLIGPVLGRQNGGSTNKPLFGSDHECREFESKYEQGVEWSELYQKTKIKGPKILS